MKKLKIASFTAHPDDVEMWIAGTLMKYKKQGHEVFMVVCTDGRRGRGIVSSDTSWFDNARIRREEQLHACELLGVEPIFLDLEDHRVIDDLECYTAVANVMEQINPDVVITHSPEDYHNDHRALSRIVLNCSWAPVFFSEIFQGVNFIPDFYVDISEFIEQKVEMRLRHKSHPKSDAQERIRLFGRWRAMQCNKAEIIYAEAFKLYKRIDWVNCYNLLPKDSFILPDRNKSEQGEL